MKAEYQLPFCVYVLLSLKDDNFYVGYTTDLPRRLDEHFQGRNTSTAPRRPFVLVHCEYYLAKADAERRETYLKTAKGRRVLRLMLQESLMQAQHRAEGSGAGEPRNQT
jgi:putative endonuclease